jgi:tripartite ATP-independent transporter DctP family solute receptor
MRSRNAVGVALALALMGWAAPALAQQEVKLAHGLAPAPNSHHGVAAKTWGETIDAGTGGRYKVREFPASALGGEREMIEGVQLGTIEAVVVSSGALSNFVPETGVFDVPFLFRDLAHARSVLDGPIGQDILAKFETAGFVAIAWGEQGFRHITNNRNAIRQPSDMAGLKLRTMENPTHITAFQALGAAPTPMAWPEVVGALQQGTIDGQENPLSVIVSAKLSEVQKYLTLSGHVYSPSVLLVSKPLWDGMTPEDQEVFRKGATEAVAAMRAFVDEVGNSGVSKLEEAGMEIGVLSPQEKAAFQAALAGAYEQYQQTYGKDLIDSIIATR